GAGGTARPTGAGRFRFVRGGGIALVDPVFRAGLVAGAADLSAAGAASLPATPGVAHAFECAAGGTGPGLAGGGGSAGAVLQPQSHALFTVVAAGLGRALPLAGAHGHRLVVGTGPDVAPEPGAGGGPRLGLAGPAARRSFHAR